MTDCGWVCLHRKSIKNPLFQKPLVWHYWQYCLLKANHTDKKIIWNKGEMIIEKGSFITGRKKAAQETGLSEQNIRTAIDTLINLGMITKSTTNSTSRFTYLTICNYGRYQEKNNEANHQINQQPTSSQPAANHKQQLQPLKPLITKDIYTLFLAEWNKQEIIIHDKLLSGTGTAIKKALKDYSQNEIFKAFQNYKKVISGTEYFFTYKWTLKDFLNRGVGNFIDAADPLNNFKLKNKPVTDGSDIEYL